MLQPEISQFLKPRKLDQNADSNRENPQKSENIFVQSMKRRLMECNVDSNFNTSAQTQPKALLSVQQHQNPPNKECTNEKCVSILYELQFNISIYVMKLFFQLKEKQALSTKYDGLKIKHAKLTAVLEDYQIRIGDLSHSLEELKMKRKAECPRESTSEVFFYVPEAKL